MLSKITTEQLRDVSKQFARVAIELEQIATGEYTGVSAPADLLIAAQSATHSFQAMSHLVEMHIRQQQDSLEKTA